MDGVHLIERINKRGALIKVLDKPHLDLTTPIGRGFIAFLSAIGRRRAPAHRRQAPTPAERSREPEACAKFGQTQAHRKPAERSDASAWRPATAPGPSPRAIGSTMLPSVG